MWSGWPKNHTVWFERPFLLRLGTLLPDYTILGKLDFRSRTSEAGLWSGAGLTRNWTISQFVSKYTVLFLEPIRSLLDPSRVSHTDVPIIGWDTRKGSNSEQIGSRNRTVYLETKLGDSSIPSESGFGSPASEVSLRGVYYWDVGLLLDSLPKPDFRSRTHLELGYLPIRLQIHGPIPWTNPFTIRPFSGVSHYYWDVGLLLDSLPKPDFRSRTHLELSYLPISSPNTRSYSLNQSVHYWILFGCPTLLLGRRTTGKGIGANTHHCVSNSDRMAGWAPSQLSE